MDAKADSKASPPLLQGDLLKGAKELRHTTAPEPKGVEMKASPEDLDALVELYGRHRGDIPAMFEELGEDPGKALKYRPGDSKEFARKYASGFYTYVPDAKSSRK